MEISCKKINTSNGKIIHSYDNIFSFDEREKYHNFIVNSRYLITGSDATYNGDNDQIYSRYNDDDLQNLGITKTKGFEYLNSIYNLNERKIKQIRVNCSTPFEKSNIHTDFEGLTFLLYVNKKWELNWMGHTMFLNEQFDEVEYLSLYKPGKVIIFDGTIPHMVVTPNHQSNHNRLTFVIQYGVLNNG